MKKTFLFCFLLFACNVKSQNLDISKVIVNKVTKEPLAYVTIFNESDNTISNSEGKFTFVSNNKEINFRLLGYFPVKTTFDVLKNKDSVFMYIKPIVLDEVVVSNLESVMKKVYDNISKNYLQSAYTENFFLRGLMKKNDELVRLQDFFGKVNRGSMFQTSQIKENKYEVEISNMRKTDIGENRDNVYFKFPSFKNLFQLMSNIIKNDSQHSNLTEIKSNDEAYRRINFISKIKGDYGRQARGFFVVKKEDFAITQFFCSYYNDPDSIPYQKIKEYKIRTTKLNMLVNFNQNSTLSKYYLSSADLDIEAEIIHPEKETENITHYNESINYFVAKSFTNEEVKSNFSINKDIFKAKFPYSKDFWNNQNQLPLTTELEAFLSSVNEKKDKTKEYEIIGNF